MKKAEKQILLARLIELYVLKGESIIGFMGKPLSFYDFDKIIEGIKYRELSYYGEILTKF